MTRERAFRPSLVLLGVLGVLWLVPVAWILVNAIRPSADSYRPPWDLTWPPAVGNLGEAWTRGELGGALWNSAQVTGLTIAFVLLLAVPAAYALTWLRPPGRAALVIAVLAPFIVPTDVVIVPMFALFRTLGLINSLVGLALANVAWTVSFATLILVAAFRTIPRELGEAATVDGAGRLGVLLRIVVPLARPAIVTVAVLVGVVAWNDYGAALVLIQRPEAFTVPLALSRFATFYATDKGLTFAAMAIAIIPPVVAFVLLQRTVISGLTAGSAPR